MSKRILTMLSVLLLAFVFVSCATALGVSEDASSTEVLEEPPIVSELPDISPVEPQVLEFDVVLPEPSLPDSVDVVVVPFQEEQIDSDTGMHIPTLPAEVIAQMSVAFPIPDEIEIDGKVYIVVKAKRNSRQEPFTLYVKEKV